MVQKVMRCLRFAFAALALLLLFVAFLVPFVSITDDVSAVGVNLNMYLFDVLGGTNGDTVDMFGSLIAAFVLFLVPCVGFLKSREAVRPFLYAVYLLGFTFGMFIFNGLSTVAEAYRSTSGIVIGPTAGLVLTYAILVLLVFILDFAETFALEPMRKLMMKARSPLSIEERLAELETLRQEGTISEEEYAEARKATLNGSKE